MPISFTDYCSIDKMQFQETGAFDCILDFDSRYFIDPAIVRHTQILGFEEAAGKMERYFAGIIALLKNSLERNDMFWKKADKLLAFTEVTGTCLGYSNNGTDGNAIGTKLRIAILDIIKSLQKAGEEDPIIFELLGVFQEGIGSDRISDLVTFILLDDVCAYSKTICVRFGISVEAKRIGDKQYKLASNPFNNKPILLVPKALLSPLPVAYSFDDIGFVCSTNSRVREEINKYVDLQDKKKLSKALLNDLFRRDASFRDALITGYREYVPAEYDFTKDSSGESSWYDISRSVLSRFPLTLMLQQNPSQREVFSVVEAICSQFKNLIEDNGLWRHLYNDDGTNRNERAIQLLFYGIADAYCKANDIDLSPETNSGRGPVDFKLSRGVGEKVLVEVKLTSNSQLQHGFEKQLPVYMKQEDTVKAIYLVLDNDHTKRLLNFITFYNEQPQEVRNKITVITINGNPKESASRA